MPQGPRAPSTDHRPPDGALATRAAILTPLGQGGIAILEVAGPRAFELTAQLFRPRSGTTPAPEARRVHYGHIVDDGEVVDEVLVRLIAPREATGGEPLVEVNCHGGIVAVQRVLECFARRGAEPVEAHVLAERRTPSRIAAEAIRALRHAATPLGVETLLDQLDGALERALSDLPWEQPGRVADALRRLLRTESLGRALWQPQRVVLVGPANAGKSTLFNALAREDRMIVSPTPGTTRDTVAAEVALGGVPLWLADTAGERDPLSAIEHEAIARSRSAAAEADLVLLVLDAAVPLPTPLADILRATPLPRLIVLNKADLGLAPWAADVPDGLIVSASQGDGLDRLARRIVETLVGEATYRPGRPLVFTDRQAGLLQRALDATEARHLDAAQATIADLL